MLAAAGTAPQNCDARAVICIGEAAEDNHQERYHYSFHRFIRPPRVRHAAPPSRRSLLGIDRQTIERKIAEGAITDLDDTMGRRTRRG
jgi:hypothetical protein